LRRQEKDYFTAVTLFIFHQMGVGWNPATGVSSRIQKSGAGHLQLRTEAVLKFLGRH
jgi:hypothetical protein